MNYSLRRILPILVRPLSSQIWDLSADPRLNYLRPEDFYVSMRLIAMAQVGSTRRCE